MKLAIDRHNIVHLVREEGASPLCNEDRILPILTSIKGQLSPHPLCLKCVEIA